MANDEMWAASDFDMGSLVIRHSDFDIRHFLIQAAP
jgi:hypothetical protein